MASEGSVPLPYRLSESHLRNRTMGKIVILPGEPRSHRRAASPHSPQQRVTACIKLPIISSRHKSHSGHRHEHRRKHTSLFEQLQDQDYPDDRMAVATPDSHKKKRTSAVTERSDRSVNRTHQAWTKDTRGLFRRNSGRLGTHTSGTKDKPIAIDNDSSEGEVRERWGKRPIPFRFSTTPPLPAPASQDIYSRLNGRPNPLRTPGSQVGMFAFSKRSVLRSSPTAGSNARMRPPSIYDE